MCVCDVNDVSRTGVGILDSCAHVFDIHLFTFINMTLLTKTE